MVMCKVLGVSVMPSLQETEDVQPTLNPACFRTARIKLTVDDFPLVPVTPMIISRRLGQP